MSGAIPTPITDLEAVCDEIHDRWDTDMRSGKLLIALFGGLVRYDPRVTRIRRACESQPDLLASVIELLEPLERANAALVAQGRVLDEVGEAVFDRARRAIARATGSA